MIDLRLGMKEISAEQGLKRNCAEESVIIHVGADNE